MLLWIVCLFIGVFGVSDSLRVKDSIRIPLTSTQNSCMRVLNGTHQFGCQSDREGNTGVVTVVRTIDDIEKHLRELPWGLDRLIALVNVKNLDGKLLAELKDNSNVVGILLYRNQSELFEGFSEDGHCPNREYSFYPSSSTCEWNKQSSLSFDGSFFANYNKPVFIIKNNTEISLLMDSCYRSFNKPDTSENYRCVARMRSFMLSAGDARLCMRRETQQSSLTAQGQGLCDKLFDYNVISMLPAVDATLSQANTIVLATRMDSFSLFSDSQGGDTSVLVSLIASLSIAKSIGQNRQLFEQTANKNNRQLMMAFFHVESYGYVGSSRFVYDMLNPPTEKSKYKPDKSAKYLKFDDLNSFIELQQLTANHSTFYLHNDWQVAKQFEGQMNELSKSANDGATRTPQCNVKSLYNSRNARLPPASYQSFLKAQKLPGFVIAPFREQYEIKTLNSFFDTQLGESNPEFTKKGILKDVEAAGNIAMRVVLDFVSKSDRDFVNKFTFDKEFANKLIDCFIFDLDWKCPLFSDILKNQSIRINPHSTYPEFGGQSSIRKLVNSLMIYALGDTEAATNIRQQSECLAKNKNQDLYTYFWQNDPTVNEFRCYQTSIYQRLASSPAFEIENYDLSNSTYPSFMESRWNKIELEIFLDVGYKFEIHAFGLALIVVALSALLFYFLDESYFVNPSDVLPADV